MLIIKKRTHLQAHTHTHTYTYNQRNKILLKEIKMTSIVERKRWVEERNLIADEPPTIVVGEH